MLQILKILEGFELKDLGFGSPETVHLVTEAIGFAFADRFKYMGDPGWVKVPLNGMVSNDYVAELRKRISLDKVADIVPGDPWPYEPENTTALAVGDCEGNFVAVNQTLVNSFGCGVVIPGTGVVMNNAMYGLDPKPGSANSIDGRKRRIQNVCPTVLLFEGEPFMAIGAPGGRAIQISVSQVISNVIDHGMGIQEAIEAPRVTRETDIVYIDKRYPLEVKIGLEKKGHTLVWVEQEIQNWARPVGVLRDPKTGLLHGGVQCNFTAFESIAMGI
jgi:gamma-glutamyltranspeptidase/glutathione hydrolase